MPHLKYCSSRLHGRERGVTTVGHILELLRNVVVTHVDYHWTALDGNVLEIVLLILATTCSTSHTLTLAWPTHGRWSLNSSFIFDRMSDIKCTANSDQTRQQWKFDKEAVVHLPRGLIALPLPPEHKWWFVNISVNFPTEWSAREILLELEWDWSA